MDPNPSSDPRRNLTRGAIETAIQIGFLILLVGWCIRIVLPFVVPVIWAIVIAVAVHPVHQRLVRALPGHSALAAALLTLLGLAILIVPTVSVSGSAIESGTTLAKALASGELSVPPPPDSVASWPVIGEPIDRLWTLATNNLGDALSRLQPQLEIVGGWLLSAVGGFGAAFFQFVLAVLVAGALLAKAPAATRVARAISRRLSDAPGDDFLQLSVAAVRSLAPGVAGVAVVPSIPPGAGRVSAGTGSRGQDGGRKDSAARWRTGVTAQRRSRSTRRSRSPRVTGRLLTISAPPSRSAATPRLWGPFLTTTMGPTPARRTSTGETRAGWTIGAR